MRVTNRMMTENAIQNMHTNLERLNYLQERAASGKQFLRASDDPSNAAAALNLRSSLKTSQAYYETAQSLDEWMTANEGSLKQMLSLANRAHTLTLSGVSDTLGAGERQAFAAELDELLSQAVATANQSHEGSYLFGGFQTRVRQPPLPTFTLAADRQSVTYNGDAGVIQRNVSPDTPVTANINGEDAFQPLFDAIINARNALNANNSGAITNAVGEMKLALETVSQARQTNGARQSQVKAGVKQLEDAQLALKSLLSQKEDASLAEVISNLRNQESVYQAVLEVSNRTLATISLFDVLS